MYEVQARVADVTESATYLPRDSFDIEWSCICSIPQLESDTVELEEAREIVRLAGEAYRHVRIVRWFTGGNAEIVV